MADPGLEQEMFPALVWVFFSYKMSLKHLGLELKEVQWWRDDKGMQEPTGRAPMAKAGIIWATKQIKLYCIITQNIKLISMSTYLYE